MELPDSGHLLSTPLLPFLERPPAIYNIPFESTFGLRLAHSEENIFEMITWDYLPPVDPSKSRACADLIENIDIFLIAELEREGSEPLGELINCMRGWQAHQGKRSQALVFLLWWNSAADEEYFKESGQRQNNGSVPIDSSSCNTYQALYLAAVKDLERNGWLLAKDNLHFRLSTWGTALQLVEFGSPTRWRHEIES